jgi:excisionase family DNA binding protein
MTSTPQPFQTIIDRWLSVDEIALYLGVKRDTIYKWINRRQMPAHKVGRLWKFRKEEIDHWVCSEKTIGTGTENHTHERRNKKDQQERGA